MANDYLMTIYDQAINKVTYEEEKNNLQHTTQTFLRKG